MENNLIKASVSNSLIDENGKVYSSFRQLANELHVSRNAITRSIKNDGVFVCNGHTYRLENDGNKEMPAAVVVNENNKQMSTINKDEYDEFLTVREVKNLPFDTYEIKINPDKFNGGRYAIALFSDAHIEETVDPVTVLGYNEYNVDIAEKRIRAYFSNLISCLNEDKVSHLIFASLGDTISGFIHDELSQTNELTPIEATMKAQSLIFSGLQAICENVSGLDRIDFIGIVGNHSRTTKKVQHSNGYKLSYEWLMYHNIKTRAETAHLPINFKISSAEYEMVDMKNNGKRYLFAHGHQIKGSGNGTVCGIYPSLNRLSLKLDKNFHQDKIYIGHFHSCTSIPNAVVNGSIIGFNAFALHNGFAFEEPAQMYEVYKPDGELLLTRRIYCK